MEFPVAPNHSVITKEYIIKYIAESVGIREFLVTDKPSRKELNERIQITIRYRNSCGYFNDAKKLQDIQKLFTELSLKNNIYNELIILSFNFFHTYIALGFFS